MSNHYHLVVHLNPDESDKWSDDEVLGRWTTLFRGPFLVQRYQAGDALNAIEQDTVTSMAKVYRNRLGSLSWFMKCLNEPIARKANAEDDCTGHFWESRFHSQALCSEAALLSAMAYVDLNPVRAQMAKTLEESNYTSIKTRLLGDKYKNTLTQTIEESVAHGGLKEFDTPILPLMSFSKAGNDDHEAADVLPMRERDYIQLVDDIGRIVGGDKRGRIDPSLLPVLERLGLSAEQCTAASTDFRQHYRNGYLRHKQSA